MLKINMKSIVIVLTAIAIMSSIATQGLWAVLNTANVNTYTYVSLIFNAIALMGTMVMLYFAST